MTQGNGEAGVAPGAADPDGRDPRPELVQNLKAWQAKPPKLRDDHDDDLEIPRVDEGVAMPPPSDLPEGRAAWEHTALRGA